MRAVFKHTDYESKFKVSKRRAWYQRLTPLALFCIFLAGMGVVAVITITLNLWISSGNGSRRLSMGNTMASANGASANSLDQTVAVEAAPVTIIGSKPAQSAPKPGLVVGAVPVIVQQPIAAAAGVPASDAANNGQHVVQFASIPWAGQLSKTDNGGWMAPPEVVDQLVRDIKAYYKVMRDLEFDDYLAQRDVLFASYFDNPQLEKLKAAEAERKTYELNRDGEVTVNVQKFTEKGNRAEVQIFTKGWVDDIYDFNTKELVKAGKHQTDQRLDVRMRYDAIEGRWKFEEVLKTINLKAS